MKQRAEVARLAQEIRSRLGELPDANTATLRAMRREFSRSIKDATPDIVLQTTLLLLQERTDRVRFVAYEIVSHHKPTLEKVDLSDLMKLGNGLNSWSSVDCFALYLSGPVWLQGRVPDQAVLAWAQSEDRWWRRASLVSTVALSRHGKPEDIGKAIDVFALLVTDRDDMVVKALSWALRELAKKHPKQAREFLRRHREELGARVIREVENKLTIGLKTPRRGAGTKHI
jgi:3-methyladenine DNA glycosylase AlkD